MLPESFISVFGNVVLVKGYCSSCRRYAIVADGKSACCGRVVRARPKCLKRESQPEQRRRLPSKNERTAKLQNQNYQCFYCGKVFGSTVYRRSVPVTLRVQWEHTLPYSYTQDNRMCNLVAACQICNGLKGDLIFPTLEEAKAYLEAKRREKGYHTGHDERAADLSLLPQPAHAEKQQSNDNKSDALVRLTGLEVFRRRYSLSLRGLSAVCGGSSAGVSKASIERLCRGDGTPSYIEKAKPIILDRLRAFLMERGKPAANIDEELAMLFSGQTYNDVVFEIIVPAQRRARYIFKSQEGQTLSTIDF